MNFNLVFSEADRPRILPSGSQIRVSYPYLKSYPIQIAVSAMKPLIVLFGLDPETNELGFERSYWHKVGNCVELGIDCSRSDDDISVVGPNA